MPLRWAIVIVAIMMIVFGIQDLWAGLWNRTPTSISCAEYIRKPISAKWLDLSDCDVDYSDSIKIYTEGKLDKSVEKFVSFYAPVRSSAVPDQPIRLVVKASDDIASLLKSIEAKDNSAAQYELIKAKLNLLVQEHVNVKGTIAVGSNSDNDHYKLIATKTPENWNLAPGWSILNTEYEFSIANALAMIAGSILVLVWQWKSFQRRRAAAAEAAAAVAAEEAPEKVSDLIAQRK